MTTWIGTADEGRLVADDDAMISARDHGFTVGDGIFETMKVVHGRVFLLPWHMERLHHSASTMGIALPERLEHVVRAVVDANDAVGVHRLRLTISAGIAPLGSPRGDASPTVTCAMAPAPIHPPTARLHTVPWPRNEHSPLAGVKSTSYAENVLAITQARAVGASEALFRNSVGDICECSASNIFIVRRGQVITPPTTSGVLAGITRRFVLTLGASDVEMVEAPVPDAHLRDADEVFITSTFQDVRAVTNVDGVERQPGPVTAVLSERFARESLDSRHWS